MITTTPSARHRIALEAARRERAAAFGRIAWRLTHPFADRIPVDDGAEPR